jgi:radical SAM protein with 4Fe4S-binding SPASM domain
MPSSERRPPCAGLWSTPMVQVNGDVTTCCLDEHLVNKVGNLSEQSLSEIWNSDKLNAWRLAQIEGRFADSGPLCTQCNWRSAGEYPADQAKQWKEKWERKDDGHPTR